MSQRPIDLESLRAVLFSQLCAIGEGISDSPGAEAYRIIYRYGRSLDEINSRRPDSFAAFREGFDVAIRLAVLALSDPVRPSWGELEQILLDTKAKIAAEHDERDAWERKHEARARTAGRKLRSAGGRSKAA
jgi:hypothetical protein